MDRENDKRNKQRSHHLDPWKQTGKWSKVFFYFLALIAAILVVTSVFLVVTGN